MNDNAKADPLQNVLGTKIERGSGVSVWRQIAADLHAAIGQGAMADGEQLPTEGQLAKRYNVNRHTVRRAIASLANEGHLKAVRGRGTFVAEKPIAYPLRSRTRFSEIVSSQDLSPGGRLIAALSEPATPVVAAHLQVEPGSQLLRAETLRVVEGCPVVVGSSWFPSSLVPEFLVDYAELGSISDALGRAGFADYRRKTSWVQAAAASIEDAAQLKLDPGAPILLVESLNVTPKGDPLQFSRSRFAASAIQLVVEN